MLQIQNSLFEVSKPSLNYVFSYISHFMNKKARYAVVYTVLMNKAAVLSRLICFF